MTLSGPVLRGGLLALAAAALFGSSTPLVQRAGRGIGPFATAALLYAGAALIGAWMRRPSESEAALQRGDVPRLAWMAFFGAAVGPVALAWGLQRTSAASASLMLTLEAMFTAAWTYALYREAIGRRVWAALLLLAAGAMLLVFDRGLSSGAQALGLLAVGVATAAWGADNALSRALAERDPGQVVLGKCALGAVTTGLLAFAAGESVPGPAAALALLAVGATGYGLSLRLYLLAQRAFGAVRAGSVFAFAPFLGAGLAIGLGDRTLGWGVAGGGVLMLAGVLLHLTEFHRHEHAHDAIDHEHAHSHDDGHHQHAHTPMPDAPHSHRHRHDAVRHVHSHVPDAHHQHRH